MCHLESSNDIIILNYQVTLMIEFNVYRLLFIVPDLYPVDKI